MSNEPAASGLVSIQDAAKHFGISTRTIRRYIASGLITGYRVGPRLLRVDLEEVDKTLINPIPTNEGRVTLRSTAEELESYVLRTPEDRRKHREMGKS